MLRSDASRDPEMSLHASPLHATLANGVRVVALPLPHLGSASVSVFVRAGSRNESRRQNGISHFVEHMAFKGTHERDCQRINLDAERLGAEVNAHTDKDHTAFHMRGLARHAGLFVQMLGDIVQNAVFPPAELERERHVILQELNEDDDDPLSSAYKLFDRCAYGAHPLAQAVIGTRGNIERLGRADLIEYVRGRYGAANVVVGVAGAIDPDAVLREAAQAFGGMPGGAPNDVEPPEYLGGFSARRQAGCSQTQVLIGFPIPPLPDEDPACSVAATLFGEGMSSPLMDRLRERRGLVYYASCSADVGDLAGQFVIEASASPAHLEAFFDEVSALLREHAAAVDEVGLERARNQIAVRALHREERPFQQLEDAAQDLFAFGRIRPREEWIERVEAVTAEQVRRAFERMLARRASVAVVGKLGHGADERARRLVERLR